MFHPTISPHDPNTVLVNCDMTGAYITHDAGRTWRMFNLRGTVRFFVFDPVDRNTIYAQVTGLWRSTDNGATWTLLYPKPAHLRGVQMSSDHADEALVAEPNPLGNITALAIDPRNSRVLYVSAVKGGAAALFNSTDRGASWKRIGGFDEPVHHLWMGNSGKIVFGGMHAAGVWTPAGLQAHRTPAAFTSMGAGFDAQGRATMYATSNEGVFVSEDEGATWQTRPLPGSGARSDVVAASLHHPETAYVSYDRLQSGGHNWFGVAKTSDAGRTWTLVWKESTSAAPNIHDAWITPAMGPSWGGNPLALGVADQDPNLAYGTDYGRTMQTTDGGANWNAVYSRRVGDGTWTTTGLDVTTCYGLHFDRFDGKRRFITYTDIGLMRSEDGGRSWVRSVDGAPRRWTNTTYWVEFDPAVRGRMWAVMSGTHDLPRPKMWRHASALNYRGGVMRSDDGGRTWKVSNNGMAETAPTHILLDPASPPEHRVLYVAAFGRGVYKSTDGGGTWTLKKHGITQNEPFAWRLARDRNGTLYVVIARRSDDGSIGNSGDGAIYKSSDGAETWTPLALPSGVNGPNGLAIDPRDPQRLYLAAWARQLGMHGEDGGIYLSTDGGRSWRNVLSRDQHVYDVTIDPRNPRVLYASGFESSAWRSTDAGEHWQRIAGFNFKWGHRVIPDPDDAMSVFITTFGGSVWHGRVDGTPAPVDIATPELTPGR